MGTTNLFNSNRDLFEQICAEDNLMRAFVAVKRNKGAAGVDGQTIEAFEKNLNKEIAELAQDVREWRYRPKPVKRVEILKADGKSMRKLGIPTVRDRVLQTCLKEVIEPTFEPIFSENSYGFRPGRSQRQAVETAQRYVTEGREWVVDIDLASFFDSLSQDRLIYRLSLQISDKRILRLIGICLRSGIQQDGIYTPSTEGSVQGSPLSPLLSNVVLDELDKELEGRGLMFVRWADDSNIFVRSQKAAERVMISITKFIETRLKLSINREKSKVAQSKAVKFLGMTIIAGTIAISAKSMVKARDKIRELTRTNSPVPVRFAVENVNKWYKGWAEYHKMTQYPSQLLQIEAHVRRRLRARIVRQWKRPRTVQKRLIARGVDPKVAARNAYSNNGPWKLSHSTMSHAYNVEWFKGNTGQYIASDRKLSHWFTVKKWIKLT